MDSDVPSAWTKASSVCRGLAEDRSAPLSASATALVDRTAGSFLFRQLRG
jgi:hypothetical protein